MKKNLFVIPETDVLGVETEKLICNSPYGSQGAAGADVTSGGVYNFDDED